MSALTRFLVLFNVVNRGASKRHHFCTEDDWRDQRDGKGEEPPWPQFCSLGGMTSGSALKTWKSCWKGAINCYHLGICKLPPLPCLQLSPPGWHSIFEARGIVVKSWSFHRAPGRIISHNLASRKDTVCEIRTFQATNNCQVLPSDLFGGFKWPFQGLSDLHLGNQKVTWKKLVLVPYHNP